MKKHTIISAIATMGILLVGPTAAYAAQDVTCTTSGPNSPCQVEVTDQNETNCEVENNVDVNNNNDQNSQSGNANSGNNTNSGNVGSGDSSANNNTNTNVNINNGCGGSTQTTVTPDPVVTSTPTPAAPAVLAASTVKTLPATGVNPLSSLLIVSALAAAGAALAKFGASVFAKRSV